jgi:hypothetical protein
MLIVQHLTNLDVGGRGRLGIDLARQQSAAGHEPLIYSITHRGTLCPDAEVAEIPMIDFDMQAGFSFKLIRESAWRQMAAEATWVAEPQFSFDAMRRHYDRLYLSLAGAR